MKVAPIFFNSFRREPHSIGMGMKMRYRSVTMLEAKVTQTIALEMPAWQTSAGGC